MKIVKPSVELLSITPMAEMLLERAGRVCYKSEDKITDTSHIQFLKMIRQRGHESVVEHASATFIVVCDRGVTHEFVRHRLASYSQESTRYCNYTKGKFGNEITVIKPPGMTEEQERAWEAAMLYAERQYGDMIAAGAAPQIARSVLPNSLKTEIVATMNFRSWGHFIKLRTSTAAHPQMREVANQIRDILMAQAPTVFTLMELENS